MSELYISEYGNLFVAKRDDVLGHPAAVEEIKKLKDMLRESVRLCGEVALELGCPTSWEHALLAAKELKSKLIDQKLRVCQNCEYWGREYENVCDNDGGDKAEIKVSADDDSGLVANLVTQPDFGCVLFQEKKKLFQARKRIVI